MPEGGEEGCEARLKRLRMRSMRRGTKEMDIILERFATVGLDGLEGGDLDIYDALLWENDHDLYRWVTGQDAPPQHYEPIIARIRKAAQLTR